MKLSDLKPAPYNPRIELKPGMTEYENLKNSLLEFGFVDPPIFNQQTGCLVGGHQRVAVAIDLGFKEVETSIVDLPLKKEKILNIALNNLEGSWDEEKLTVLLEDLESDELLLTGFSQSELDDLLSDLDEIETLADKVKANPVNSNLFDSFLFPPFSYLDTKTKRWLDRKKQWKELGIKSELGREDNLVFSANLQAPGLEGTSIFDPVLCELGYRWFTPKTKSNIFDPFAGGSVRGIVAKVLGHNYTGIDLRAEQVSANYANAREIGLSDINWICDDSLDIDEHIENESQDLLFTCPLDLINDRTIFFEDTIEGTGALIEELDKKIPKISEDSTADNPVTRVIRRKALEDDLKGETDNDSRILGLLLDMDKRLSMYEDSNIIEKKKINTGNIERIRAKIYYKNEGNINVIDELEGYLFEKYRDTVQIVSVTSGNRYEDRNSEVMKVIIVNSLYSPAKIFKDIEITLGKLGMVDISVKVFP